MIRSVDGVKLSNTVSIFYDEYIEKRIFCLVEHQIELGAEELRGGESNNPLYQLAEEHHLIDIGDSMLTIIQKYSFDSHLFSRIFSEIFAPYNSFFFLFVIS
jgi:hypothetical protein